MAHIINKNKTTVLPRHVQAYGTKLGEDGEAASFLSNFIAEYENKSPQVGKGIRTSTPISLKK